jgi:hypothetical protein
MRVNSFWGRIFAFLFIPFLAFAQYHYKSENVKLLGRMPLGPTKAVFGACNEIYFGKGALLEIYNLDNVENPTEIGEFISHGVINDIYVVGNYAFLAAGNFGVEVVDVSDKANPVLAGYYRLDDETVAIFATDAYTTNPVVFALTKNDGIYVLDASTPSQVKLISQFYISGEGRGLYGDKDNLRLYVAAYRAGLHVIDIGNPNQLTQMGTYNTTGLAYGVTVSDNMAYVADYNKGLVVLNVGNPAAITKVIDFATNGAAYDVAYDYVNQFAYVAVGSHGIVAIDVNDVVYPKYFDFSGINNAVKVEYICNNTLLVADGSGGLKVTEAKKDTLSLKSEISAEGNARGLFAQGDYLYVAAGFGGFQITDVFSDISPVIVGSYKTDVGYGKNVLVSDTLAFFSNSTDGLSILSVASVVNPKLITKIEPLTGDARNSFLYGNNLFLAAGFGGVRVYSLSDILHPIETSFVTTGYSANDVIVRDTVAYVADYLNGLETYRVEDSLIQGNYGKTNVPVNGVDIFLRGDSVYLAGLISGVRIVDVSDPWNPREVNHIRVDEYTSTRAVFVQDSLMFLADGSRGLHIVKLTDELSVIGYFRTGGNAMDVAVKDGKIYVADDEDGIYILKYEKTTDVRENSHALPEDFALSQNYPNPFGVASGEAETTIKYSVPTGVNGRVSLKVFDVLGRLVAELVNEKAQAGIHSVKFTPRKLSAGIYFYTLRAGGFSLTKKMILMK